MLTATFTVPATHPSLNGHFPNHPITPGVITLDYVTRSLTNQLPGTNLVEIPHVKFLQPLLPEKEITVTYKQKDDTLYQFSCECEGSVILLGQIKLIIDKDKNNA